MNYLNNRILDNPYIPKVFTPGKEIYLVGGYLRDILRSLSSIPMDMDFSVRGDPRQHAFLLSSKVGGKMIVLKGGELARIIVGNATFDFTELKGTIEDDLLRRDFTMNALAWSPDKGAIDPTNGAQDIKKGIIRAISRRNFEDDPLRLLRAYRFQSETGWKIHPKTTAIVTQLKESIGYPARERITLEFFKLLNEKYYLRALKNASSVCLLAGIINIRNEHLRRNIKALSKFESFLNTLPEKYSFRFDNTISQALSYRGMLRAAVLLREAALETSRLSLSGLLKRRLALMSNLLSQYQRLERVQRQAFFDLFSQAGEFSIDFAIVSQSLRALREAERFLSSRAFIKPDEIMKLTGITGGQEFGLLMREMERLQFLKKILNEGSARNWLCRQKKVKKDKAG